MARISTPQIYHRTELNTENAREKEAQSSQIASSQKKIQRPSDDPTSWVTAKNLKDDIFLRESIAKNATIATGTLAATENIFGQIQEYVQRAHELAISSAGSMIVDAKTPRQSVLAEVKALFESMRTALNSSFNGRTLLAGYQSQLPAFDTDGNFIGDNGRIEIDIDKGLKAALNVSTEQIVLGRNREGGVDIPKLFQRLIVALEAGDRTLIGTTLEDFTKSVDQLSLGRAQIGAAQGEIQRALSSESEDKILKKDTVSKIEDVDVIRAFSDLARDQTVLKATLSTTEKVLHEVPQDALLK